MDKQLNHQPGFFAGWNGAATAGATLVAATQNQYTVSGGIGLVRTVPTVSWLNPRDRTSVDFTGSFGKITQPAYTSGTTTVPPSSLNPPSITPMPSATNSSRRVSLPSARLHSTITSPRTWTCSRSTAAALDGQC